MRSNLVKEYLSPVRIMDCSENVENEKALLINRSKQIFIKEKNYLRCYGKGHIILDFGKEMHGGIRVLSHYLEGQKTDLKIRIRFGESVNEACAELGDRGASNDHSVRDMVVLLPDLCDQEWGQTGFRFVRIDFLDEDKEYRLVNVYAASTFRDLPYRGDFECDDPLINEIYRTARYTIYLNMQTNLWEGIKRDRLVWVGDMQPEVLAITDIFGADDCVEDALQLSIEKNPLPCWFGNIPTYSFWFIQILYDYYMKVKNTSFVLKQMPYVQGVLEQLDACVTEDGNIDYTLMSISARTGYFLDWPTNGTKDAKAGNRFMYIFTIENLKKFYKELGLPEDPLCDKLLRKLRKRTETGVEAKQIVAFGYLSEQIPKEEAAAKLTDGGAKGLSTFMSYFILKAIAESHSAAGAIEIMKEYYGGMLSRGATSFWEDFDVEWLKNSGRIDEFTPVGKLDLHGDFGKFCYKGFRHSLCHGWSCGPVQFLVENILGVHVEEAGCRTIRVSPRLGNLKWCKGIFPTPYGEVKISHRVVDGKVVTKTEAPVGVQVIVNGK
ncbi:MAG: alpha-L-rhamnosidase [Clostridia bacterium]|nr:alpha-L-rhamnosidase [Clostridia bacterium]